jgi:Zn-dependent protease with chaperone function
METGAQIMAGMGARPLRPDELPVVHHMVEDLATQSGQPMPEVWFLQSRVPEACAAGESAYVASVCVSTGLLERLDVPELRAVLAHEIAHIAQGHVADRTRQAMLDAAAMGAALGWGAGELAWLLTDLHPAFALVGLIAGAGGAAYASRRTSQARPQSVESEPPSRHNPMTVRVARGAARFVSR